MAFSVNSPIGDGVTTQFAVSFTNGLYSRDNVHVFVGDETTERAFTWINDGLIDVQGTVPAVGEVVTIRRIMDKTNKAVDFADGEILDERNLDTMVDQLYNISHEFLDGYGLTEVNVDIDMRGNSLTNVGGGDPNDPGSLATIGDLQGAIVSPEDLVDAVRISNNFSDLDDTAVCRTNLDVYSKAEVQEVTQANANILINGDFQVWQRGSSHTPTVSDTYYADRWLNSTTSNGETRQIRDVGLGQGYRIVGSNTTAFYQVSQRVELNYALREALSNNTYTCSFVGNLPDVTDSYRVFVSIVHTGGTEVVGYVPIIKVGNKYTATINLPDLSSLVLDDTSYLNIAINNNISPAPDGNYDIYQVKLEKGDVTTRFEVEPYGDVLAKCHRYYFQMSNNWVATRESQTSGAGANTARKTGYLPCVMRTSPSVQFINTTYENITTVPYVDTSVTPAISFNYLPTTAVNFHSIRMGIIADAEL